MRRAIRSVAETLAVEQLADLRERSVMAFQVPDLWAASLVQLTETMQMVADLVAERLGRSADDRKVRAFAGALIGVMISQLRTWAEHPDVAVLASVDDALTFLEAGLPIESGDG